MLGMALTLLLSASLDQNPSSAQATPPLPGLIETLPCAGPGDEIVVCGRRSRRTDTYRIPEGLREGPLTTEHYAWSARARDELEADRYGGQAVGPAGFFRNSRQTYCEWKAARQEINGQMIDCSERVRPRAPE
jgi:hypothetical protein